MKALVEATQAEGFWMLQASMFPENVASIRTHERVGFRVVGTRERIARFNDGRWRNTQIMECQSAVTGVD
jgi:phosphinothricin acetyltransferase